MVGIVGRGGEVGRSEYGRSIGVSSGSYTWATTGISLVRQPFHGSVNSCYVMLGHQRIGDHVKMITGW